MSRRGTNIYKRKDGRWEGRMKKEGAGDGVRKYRSVYGRTYTEVKSKMEAARTEERLQKAPEKYTVAEAVVTWLDERKPYWKQTTCTIYQNTVDKYILPKLGDVQISRMDEAELERFCFEIRQEEELANGYLRNICAVLMRAMKHMKKRHHYEIEIPSHILMPCKTGERILPGEAELAILEQYLLKRAKAGDDTCLGILTALYTGMRIGEICALTWGDISLKEGIIYVRKNLQRVKAQEGKENSTEVLFQLPKTSTSQRMIPIPPVLMPLLIEKREPDENYLIKGKKKLWAEPRTLQYRFARILSQCGLDKFNFHMLRHAFATRCMEGGFDVKSLSEILGHSNTQITLNLYIHSSMQRKKQLMDQFDMCLYHENSSY
ncbi:MAG: site-specific integrase [Muribaculaceae bacterium]|nr:site-specific integrase [Muribaculaceae bacterium]